MKKIILFFVILTLSMLAFNIFAFASDMEEDAIIQESVNAENPGEEVTENAPSDIPQAPEENDGQSESTSEKNFFTSLFDAYEENKSELFSALSAIISLCLVFVYQKGLLPILKSGITLIEGQVKGLKEVNTKAKENSERVGADALALAEKMQLATEQMREMTENLLMREGESAKRDEEFHKMRQCILWQANLLGEVFLASSLPEFSKERVGRVVSEVEAMLGEGEGEQA